jgi:arginyl-tRNA synthetase
MDLLADIKRRFDAALSDMVDDPSDLLEMIRPTADPKFGDYQANCAMPLKAKLGKSPRDIAAEIVERLDVADICQPPEIAGPGFINLRVRDDWILKQVELASADPRVGVANSDKAKTIVVDFSSPNVAKPMHVGHIRSTVIGDALCRVLKFLGHNVISDNHLGDWGTQFGMIIYGYKHFVEDSAFQDRPVAELTRLYRLVNQLIEYQKIRTNLLGAAETEIANVNKQMETLESTAPTGDKKQDKKNAKQLKAIRTKREQLGDDVKALQVKLARVESDAQLASLAASHANIAEEVLQETAKLHAGDADNKELWNKFLPHCQNEIQRIYDRLDIQFDYAYGESHYHDQLPVVVEELQAQGMSQESDGAQCVFLDGFDAPMIIQKKDGAFLYATSDLATIRFRADTWDPDIVLYVVDQRQHEHFMKLFAAARAWGYDSMDLQHVAFGTVLGEDGKPLKTRDGDLVELGDLLDQAVAAAYATVKDASRDLDEDARREVAEMVGIGATKYNDLNHNRSSDYKFDLQKMVQLNGDTATYIQYSYARCCGIFAKGDIDRNSLRQTKPSIIIGEEAERSLAMEICRFQSALEEVIVDYRPNQLTTYLYKLADSYSKFFEKCPVLKAESEELKASRVVLCDLTARVLKTGLGLLGIGVRDRM